MSNLTILRTYALKAADKLPSSVLFRSSEKFYTIFDAYPKSTFHFLVLPRLHDDAGYSERDVANLKSLLQTDKEKARELITGLKSEALEVKKEIEEEMVERYGFKWDVWIGFHAVPSMVHLHLHVLSADLVSERMKNKKHYNSFHPSLGFFLHINDVLSWFEAEPSYFSRMARLDVKSHEALLKGDLECWKCKKAMKNIPTLKQHLQEEFDKVAAREKSKRPAAKKRKASAEPEPEPKNNSNGEGSSKRSKTEDPSEENVYSLHRDLIS